MNVAIFLKDNHSNVNRPPIKANHSCIFYIIIRVNEYHEEPRTALYASFDMLLLINTSLAYLYFFPFFFIIYLTIF